MYNINSTQIQSTNDACTISKCSAASKNYFKDDFIEEFVGKKKSRVSLIHLGYYTRAVILQKLVTNFIEFLKLQEVSKFQIVSCGSGFDTTFWRLSDANLLSENSLFIEIDFPDLISRKVSLIKKSQKLYSYIRKSVRMEDVVAVNHLSDNYLLIEADLSDLDLIKKLFKELKIDFDVPTLFLSECVITYMKEQDSNQLIKWMAENFKNGGFINYEQIHPEDGFGKVMLRHFEKLQSSLFSVSGYPDCRSHRFRYKQLGFETSSAISEWEALEWLTSLEERQTALSLEQFDEFEEFHLKCVHYVVGVAGNQVLSSWINSLPFSHIKHSKDWRDYLKWDHLDKDIELYGHSSCSSRESIFLFGGCDRKGRSFKAHKISRGNLLRLESIKCSEKLISVHGNAVYFELDHVPHVCVYGGRSSPDKVSYNGSAVIFEVLEGQLLTKLVIGEAYPCPLPRYRSSMVCFSVSGNEVDFWIFGGRCSDLNTRLADLWQLTISHDSEKKLSYRWKSHEKRNEDRPCSRMSHSSVACSKTFAVFISGGVSTDSWSVLDDIWKWCCKSESWKKLDFLGKLLPRYGHTSHLVGDVMYLVGGVNTLPGFQPGIARVDLKELTVLEFALQPSDANPSLLFNHTSEVVEDGDSAEIVILGGGGNCFSFGTFLNRGFRRIRINQFG